MAKSTNYRAPVRAHKDPAQRAPVDRDGEPALPVPPARFVPMVRHEPMRRSTRRERMEEVHIPFRRFLTPCNVPDAELTDAELRARRAERMR